MILLLVLMAWALWNCTSPGGPEGHTPTFDDMDMAGRLMQRRPGED